MNPKKSKVLVDEVAEELGLDKSLVKKVVDYYWNQVYDSITNIKYTDILISNLGTFVIKEKQLNKKIEGYTNYLQDQENLTFSKYHSYKTIEKQLEQMLEAKKIIDEINESKENFYKNKASDK